MATIQSTDLRIAVEPTIALPEFDFGPLDTVAANAVLLTRENLRKVGAYPPRNGYDWGCLLWVYQVVAGVETIMNMSDQLITGSYWDPVARAPTALTIANAGALGHITVSFDWLDDPVAGMYKFAVTSVAPAGIGPTDRFDLMTGWLEILPAIPS